MKANPLGVGMKVKNFFFDKQAVINDLAPRERKFLSKFGAFVRTGARRSIKPGGKSNITSDPDEPPRSHQGDIKKIFFAYEPTKKNVVIGPILLGGKVGDNALEALEYGGNTLIEEFNNGKRRKRRAHVEARPLMQPAFEREKSNISSIWRSV